MKTALLKQEKKLKLSVINNTPNKRESLKTSLLINTLYPNFTYQNAKREVVSTVKQALI